MKDSIPGLLLASAEQRQGRAGQLAESRAWRNPFAVLWLREDQSKARSALRSLESRQLPAAAPLEVIAAAGSSDEGLSGQKRGVWKWWPERMGAKLPKKAGLVPRWHDTREDAGFWFQPYYLLKILLQSPVSMKTWVDAQNAKTVKSTTALVETRVGVCVGGQQLEPLFHSHGDLLGVPFEKN